eukprot:TRINITY_DN5330_c0_g2_i1.p3 TRINITY_DN5330_c0_g2~~TRINITY_DN5330_c0_g2_i1.p3  ORF type:complete len:106 (-),score=0.02 TRINITY_DN5330_c0_g2_i1:208-525(-)
MGYVSQQILRHNMMFLYEVSHKDVEKLHRLYSVYSVTIDLTVVCDFLVLCNTKDFLNFLCCKIVLINIVQAKQAKLDEMCSVRFQFLRPFLVLKLVKQMENERSS